MSESTKGLRYRLAACLAAQDGWRDPDALWTDSHRPNDLGRPVWMDYGEDADALITGPLAPLLNAAQAIIDYDGDQIRPPYIDLLLRLEAEVSRARASGIPVEGGVGDE